MPQLDHTGPENKGSKTGRKLGLCKTQGEEPEYMYGEGMGLKKRPNNCEKGLGKRLRSSNIFNDNIIS